MNALWGAMFSTRSLCTFDIFNGLCAARLGCAIHRLWRSGALFSIRIAHSHSRYVHSRYVWS